MKNSNNKLIYLIVFLAGFSFLIYEVSWNRYLSLILGTTVTASTIVLMSFMAGMGVGAFFLGKRANKIANSGRFLSFLLGGIGLMSLVNFLIIGNVIPAMYGTFQNHNIADLIFFIFTFILLFIPAFFMGGVIPIVSKIAISENKNISKKLGRIYALETLGSSLGGLITGFVLLGMFGQKQTIFIAVMLNLLVAVSLFLSKKFNNILKVIPEKKSKKSIGANSVTSGKIAKLSMFFIGFSMLGLQIIWMRIFKTYFTNTSYTFTIITTFVILGLSIGSWLYMKKGSFIKNNDFAMLKSVLLISLLSLLGLFLLYNLPELLLFPFGASIENQFIRLILVPIIASIIIVLPSAMVSGFAFPLACKMYSEGAKNISKNVGNILMTNTVGSVIGPAVATFLIIPLLGVGKSILFIVLFLSGLLVYFAHISKTDKKISKFKNVFIAKSAIILLIIIFANPIHFYPPSIRKFDKEILAYNETVEGTIVVVNEPEKGIFGNSTFVNNSSVIGSNYDAIKAVKMVGHIPFFAGLKCENALIIGFGIGVTTSAIASHSEVKNIDCVELVPGLVKTAHYYKEFNLGVYNDNRINIIQGDGRHFLQITSKKYDLISCDPTHPVLGSGNLYTQEYFQQCYDHLNPEGMISQYLPLHKLRLKDLLGIIKTFHSVFPNSTVWLGQYHAILFGKKSEGKIDFETWKDKVEQMPRDDFFYFEPYHIAASVIFDSESIENFPSDLKINTDNLSYTEFFSFDCFDDKNLYENLKYFSENRCPIDNVFSNIENYPRMDEFVQGNIKLMESLYFSLKNDKEKALNELRAACKVNPEDQEYPFLLKFYYGVAK